MYKEFDYARDLIILILILWVGFININVSIMQARINVLSETNTKLFHITKMNEETLTILGFNQKILIKNRRQIK